MLLITTLISIILNGTAITYSMQTTSNLINIQELIQYKIDMKTITDQQLAHKENYGYYEEFTLETTPTNKTHKSTTGTTFYVTSPNVSINFYYKSSNCLVMEAINYNLSKKTTWDSCDQLAVIHKDLN